MLQAIYIDSFELLEREAANNSKRRLRCWTVVLKPYNIMANE